MSTYEALFENRATELFANSGWATVAAEYLSRIKNGLFAKWYQDAVFQKWERFPVTIYDALAFSQIHSLFGQAKVLMAKINMDAEPLLDKDISGNNAILSELGGPFSGKFWGGNQDSDGVIEVKRPIEFDMENAITGERVVREISGVFPLEVGFISAQKTLFYLNQPGNRGCLARWPYDSKTIYLMQRV